MAAAHAVQARVKTELSSRQGGYSPIGLYWDVPLDRVWVSVLAVLNRVYNFTRLCPKQV